MNLKVDAIVNPALFEYEETELMKLAIAPQDEDKYSLFHPSSNPGNLTDRPEMLIIEWDNMDFDKLIQPNPTYIDRI